MDVQEFFSHGKLLLTGEYVVLDGAKAIALPCKLGQSLKVQISSHHHFEWNSYLKNAQLWQSSAFEKKDLIEGNFKNNFEKRLFEILNVIRQFKPKLFEEAWIFTTQLDFEKEWGLGSSSTLINNLAQWAGMNPYSLLDQTFGGSGYDIAAANMTKPFLYSRQNSQVHVQDIDLHQKIKNHIYFVFLKQKQNSREGIAKYREKQTDKKSIAEISRISDTLYKTDDLHTFEKLLISHEALVSKIIEMEPVQSKLFSDYKSGIVKSLGAWGGDFVLVTAKHQKVLEYFSDKGYNIIFTYKNLIF